MALARVSKRDKDYELLDTNIIEAEMKKTLKRVRQKERQQEEKQFVRVPSPKIQKEEFAIPSKPKTSYAAIAQEFSKRQLLAVQKHASAPKPKQTQIEESFEFIDIPKTPKTVVTSAVDFQVPKRRKGFTDYVQTSSEEKHMPKISIFNPFENIADVEKTHELLVADAEKKNVQLARKNHGKY